MDKLLFGISGLPIGDENTKYTYATGIAYLKSLGLDAMELPFVRSVNITEKNKDAVLKEKLLNDFYLSAHGSYYINLNSDEEEKQKKSIERIVNGAEALQKVQGRSIIFHPGFYLKDTKKETLETIKNNLLSLPYFGVDYRLETTGKATQFGSLDELVEICKSIPSCKLCIDFSHIHARYNGCLKTYDDFVNVLQYVKDNLGEEALNDLHMHAAGINYGPKGEKNHLPFEESDFNYKDFLKALKTFNVKGCLICESPLLEKDALLLKNYYNSL
ncbi:MAG: TIM barrel protein [Clostridium sp.]